MGFRIVTLAVLLGLIGTGTAAAERSFQFVAGVDYFSTGDVNENFENDMQRDLGGFISDLGFTAVSGETETSEAFGGRFGLMFPVGTNGELGASFGYIPGPEIEQTFNLGGAGVVTAMERNEYEITWMRALLEAAFLFPVTENVGFRIGGGAGAAQGDIEKTTTRSGTLVSTFDLTSSESRSDDWVGFTWEASAAFIWGTGRTQLETGARFAGFPSSDGSDEIPEVDWQPFGLYAALRF